MVSKKNRRLCLINVSCVLAFVALTPISSRAQVWTVIAAKANDTTRDRAVATAAQVSYRYDKQEDLLWFRVSVYGAPNENEFGVNIVLDTGAEDSARMNWWGANKSFRFDKLVTAWVTRGATGYQGTIGIGDATGIKLKQFNNLFQNNLQIKVAGDSFIIGVKRSEITDKLKMNLIAGVGSNQQWQDDLPQTGFATIDLTAAKPKLGLREIDLSRNNFQFPSDYKTLPNSQAPAIRKQGHGPQKLILIPGMYSGKSSFETFMARNQSRYTFYVLTPPGINGTPARVMPTTGLRLGERIWTRLLERDILNLINREKIRAPVIIAESHPASIAAVDLALEHPDRIGGVVVAGTNLIQFFPSPSGRSPVTPEQRVELVEDGWATKWFKYVTPETWVSNDMLPETLNDDLQRGQKASQEIESALLPIKVRYLCEFWASDVTRDFDKLQVPVLALVAGFDEKYLADPANRFTKMVYVDSWETLVPKNANVQVARIPGVRLLIFQNESTQVDDTIGEFIAKRVKK